jgi:Flp pilus assembly protein TadG
MTGLRTLIAESRASAAAELALVMPLLLLLFTGCLELGNYFFNEHILVKSVRDGARYAARQDISGYTACTGEPPAAVVNNTKAVVMTGLLDGGTNRLASWSATTITLGITCSTSAGSTALGGFYAGVKNSAGTVVGAPIVTVSATVPYVPVIAAMGFSAAGLNLVATQQAAVIGW